MLHLLRIALGPGETPDQGQPAAVWTKQFAALSRVHLCPCPAPFPGARGRRRSSLPPASTEAEVLVFVRENGIGEGFALVIPVAPQLNFSQRSEGSMRGSPWRFSDGVRDFSLVRGKDPIRRSESVATLTGERSMTPAEGFPELVFA